MRLRRAGTTGDSGSSVITQPAASIGSRFSDYYSYSEILNDFMRLRDSESSSTFILDFKSALKNGVLADRLLKVIEVGKLVEIRVKSHGIRKYPNVDLNTYQPEYWKVNFEVLNDYEQFLNDLERIADFDIDDCTIKHTIEMLIYGSGNKQLRSSHFANSQAKILEILFDDKLISQKRYNQLRIELGLGDLGEDYEEE